MSLWLTYTVTELLVNVTNTRWFTLTKVLVNVSNICCFFLTKLLVNVTNAYQFIWTETLINVTNTLTVTFLTVIPKARMSRFGRRAGLYCDKCNFGLQVWEQHDGSSVTLAWPSTVTGRYTRFWQHYMEADILHCFYGEIEWKSRKTGNFANVVWLKRIKFKEQKIFYFLSFFWMKSIHWEVSYNHL